MDFSQEDKHSLLQNLLDISNEKKEYLGSDLKSILEFGAQLSVDEVSIEELILNTKNTYFLKEENSRIVVFYSFLKMLGTKRLNSFEKMLFAKEAGLKLGLNSIGVSQMIHLFKTGKSSKMTVSDAIRHFKVYQN